jgi:tripeptide aminopeptidase
MTRLDRLKDVMAVQTTSYNTRLMNDYILKYVKELGGCKVIKKDGNIYVTKGKADIYPCVVAHTDTVHDIEKELHVIQVEDVLLSVNDKYERCGIGGDDKVGIFVALELLRNTSACKVAFFRDEEVGCVGSGLADMKFFDDVAFVLQCDRKGYEDFVNEIFYSKLYSDEFSNAIQGLLFKYGRVESDGGLTDVYQLTENGLDVCVANLSCGYYDPHSDNEYIKIHEVFATSELVQELANDLGDRRWDMPRADRESYSNFTGGYGDEWNSATSRHDTGNYRAYGKSKAKKSYNDHLPDEWTWEDEDKSKGGYLVPDATCGCCGGKEKLSYDETISRYFCFGCDDYVFDEDVEFSSEKSDNVRQYIEDRDRLINSSRDEGSWDDDDMPF